MRTDLELAREIVLREGWNAFSYHGLNTAMQRWFAPEGDAFVAYVEVAGYRVVAGAPVSPSKRLPTVAADFVAATHRSGLRSCFFGVEAALLPALAAVAPTTLQLGAQPIWHPQHWLEHRQQHTRQRRELARLRRRMSATRWPAQAVQGHRGLLHCRDAWLAQRPMPPLRFLVNADILDELGERRVYVAETGAQVIGVLVVNPLPRRNGWVVDLMARAPNAPNGVIDVLLDTAVSDLAASGASCFSLGLAPLVHLAQPTVVAHSAERSQSARLLRLVRAAGRPFYNFDGLAVFKSKHQPAEWEPLFLLSDATTATRTLYAVAAAFCGREPFTFLAQALLRRATQPVKLQIADLGLQRLPRLPLADRLGALADLRYTPQAYNDSKEQLM
jgi:phosphatidylglycerol lysyltransferase